MQNSGTAGTETLPGMPNGTTAAGRFDAVVVGSGPNGLSAAIALARDGYSVLVLEAAESAGGGARSEELTLPGFVHDTCSSTHPMAAASTFFQSLPLADHGLEWVYSPAELVHPFDDGEAAILFRDVGETGKSLGVDAEAYRRFMDPLVRCGTGVLADLLGPVFRVPRHPIPYVWFGLGAMQPAQRLARSKFRGRKARALFAGIAAHACVPLDFPFTSSIGMALGLAGHAVGWPFPRGGTQKITDALCSYFRTLGGTIETGQRIGSLAEIPPANVILLDLTPRQVVEIAGDRLQPGYRKKLERFRYGPAAFKLDWALDGPIPWRSPLCSQSGTLHLGGTLDEIAASEQDNWQGRISERPFVLLTQHSLFDSTRAPAGKHAAWAYCHVPNGSTIDMTERIEAQVERFAPGFRDRILARSVRSPAKLEAFNANDVGGDISGGANSFPQILFRPTLKLEPYEAGSPGLYLCSSSTPPGAGVHGLCGYFAAQSALRYLRRRKNTG